MKNRNLKSKLVRLIYSSILIGAVCVALYSTSSLLFIFNSGMSNSAIMNTDTLVTMGSFPSSSGSSYAPLYGALGTAAIGLAARAFKKNKNEYSSDHCRSCAEVGDYVDEVDPVMARLRKNPTKPHTPDLDKVNSPDDLKGLNVEELERVAADVRADLISSVSQTGGHFGAGLGVVDLTVALHRVFDTPKDKILWDVAHQAYPHKILTGRRDRMRTIRQGGGLSGFTKRSESKYDHFGAGHSSTAISASTGIAVARDLNGDDFSVVSVVGDGAMTGGMVYEAMNHVGFLKKKKFLVVLNDNDQVSLPTSYNAVDQPVGALSQALKKLVNSKTDVPDAISKVISSPEFQDARNILKKASKELFPPAVAEGLARLEEYARGFLSSYSRGTMFEELGFYYVGPVDGHNMSSLVDVLSNLKKSFDEGKMEKPVLLHVKTEKGKGYKFSEKARDKLHALTPFDIETGKTFASMKQSSPSTTSKGDAKPQAYTSVFATALINEAKKDDKIIAINAAMPGGTGLDKFEKEFGQARTFDVGICEQHAVTFAAGMATEKMKPFVAIYSTFLQRAYDQIVHDVCIQNLPVRFALDRAGVVGDDGPTHHGLYDIAYLSAIPNMRICAPSDEAEMVNMTHTLAKLDDGPVAVRYPRGKGPGAPIPDKPEFLTPGEGRIICTIDPKNQEGVKSRKIAILSFGARLDEGIEAGKILAKNGHHVTIADARWAKPLDTELVEKLADENDVVLTIEEGSSGGFASNVLTHLALVSKLERTKVRPIFMHDQYIDHDTQEKQRAIAGVSVASIVRSGLAAVNSY